MQWADGHSEFVQQFPAFSRKDLKVSFFKVCIGTSET